ncbi:serine hydrolase [Falsibacillus pallidus]|uniref:serine hydrolase n=1 Tax=Falsibacillus pallidus TaxID=493781 RepID=UPI003D965B86
MTSLKSLQANNMLRLRDEITQLAAACPGRIGVAIETHEGRILLNEMDTFPSASLIKLPILIECFRQVEAGKMLLDQSVDLSALKRVGGAGVLPALSDSVKLTVKDFMTLMIIVSDNTATNFLIDLGGEKEINDCIQTLQLKQTSLGRRMMDFEAIKNGKNNYTSPEDILHVLKEIDRGKLLQANSRDYILQIMKQQQFVDKLPALMDTEIVSSANKTGELDGVEHDCGIFTYGEKTVYASVLIDGLYDKELGRKTISRIGKAIFDYLIKH